MGLVTVLVLYVLIWFTVLVTLLQERKDFFPYLYKDSCTAVCSPLIILFITFFWPLWPLTLLPGFVRESMKEHDTCCGFKKKKKRDDIENQDQETSDDSNISEANGLVDVFENKVEPALQEPMSSILLEGSRLPPSSSLSRPKNKHIDPCPPYSLPSNR